MFSEKRAQRSAGTDGSDAGRIQADSLGSAEFRNDHGVKYAYVAGAMVKGIASADLVIRMGRARLLSYYGSGGQRPEVVEAAIRKIRSHLEPDEPYGVNLLHNILMPELEDQIVDLFLAHGVREVEAAAYVEMTPALVRYRLRGVRRLPSGRIIIPNSTLGKASRPEVASLFLSPPPHEIVDQLLRNRKISREEAELARFIPMADDLCAEADSGGHTDRQVSLTLIPSFLRLRDRFMREFRYTRSVRVGAAGGIGSPEAIAAVLMLGAEFVLTGTINQCTVESGASDRVKDLLAAAGIHDTTMSPAGDMFEIGAQVQVLKKGVLFPARARKLYELYRRHHSLDELDAKTRRTIEQQYFGRSFEEVWDETRSYYQQAAPKEVEEAESNPKQKMAMIFRWYFIHSNRLALRGVEDDQSDFQVHCGPAIGAINEWLKGTDYEPWRCRHVDEIGERLMQAAAKLLERRYNKLSVREQFGSTSTMRGAEDVESGK